MNPVWDRIEKIVAQAGIVRRHATLLLQLADELDQSVRRLAVDSGCSAYIRVNV